MPVQNLNTRRLLKQNNLKGRGRQKLLEMEAPKNNQNLELSLQII